jgi:hypothetical protein
MRLQDGAILTGTLALAAIFTAGCSGNSHGTFQSYIEGEYIGTRDARAAYHFMHDLQNRLVNRVQLTSDGHTSYLPTVVADGVVPSRDADDWNQTLPPRWISD